MNISITIYLIISVIVAFLYLPIILFGIEPKTLYLLAALLFFISISFLRDNFNFKKIVFLYFLIMLLTIFTFIKNDLFVLLNNETDLLILNSKYYKELLIIYA